jgi:hypothetical protein
VRGVHKCDIGLFFEACHNKSIFVKLSNIHTNKTPPSHRNNTTSTNHINMLNQRNYMQKILILILPIRNYNRRNTI